MSQRLIRTAKWTALLLMLVLPVFASLAEATHHHDDNALHPDCVICIAIAGQILTSAGTDIGPAVSHEFVLRIDPPLTVLSFVSQPTPRLTGRSPPA